MSFTGWKFWQFSQGLSKRSTAPFPIVSKVTSAPQLRGWLPGRALWEPLRADHLLRNSLYLILSSGLQAALGFLFWIIAARLFTTADVGKASSLIAATAVIAYVALLGLNNTFVRYLPTATDRDALLTAGLLLVAASGTGVALLYILLTPVIAPRLAFVEHRPAMAVGFVLLTAAGAVNLLTDSVFISSRKAGYTALVDGGIGGITKVAAAILVGTGAYGLFCASASGYAAAALASILLMVTALHYRPSLRNPLRTLIPLLRFSGAAYAGNVLNLLPPLVVPLIVLDRLGASSAAYYFVAFQVANLLYATAYAVEQAFLAEGSQANVDWPSLLRRSRRVLMMVCLPSCLALVVAAHWLLLAFGTKYSQHATPALMVLAAAVISLAANSWLQTVLRLHDRLQAIVVSNGVYAIAICGLAWVLAPHGLTALTAAWPVGGLVGAAAAAVPKKAPWTRSQTAPRRPGSLRSSWLASRRPGARRWWPALTSLTVVAVGVSLLWPAGRHQWALSLVRQPTRYTALSFNQAAKLPAAAAPGQEIPVSFSIDNREGRAVGYRYVLSASEGDNSRILGESARTVAAGATWKVLAMARPECATSPCRIAVTLPGHPEAIDFLVALKTVRGNRG